MSIIRPLSAAIAALLLVPAGPAAAADTATVGDAVRSYAGRLADDAHVPGWVFVMADRTGVVVAEAGGLADLAAGRPMTVDTPLRVGSISKPVTAALAAELAAKGTIDLDAPADRSLDVDLTDRYGPASTIRALLQHRGGYPDAFVGSHHLDPGEARTLAEWVSGLDARSIDPDVVASYSSVGYTLAGAAIAGATGMPFAAAADRHLFGPLGMSGATFEQPAPAGTAVGYRWTDGGLEPYPPDVPDLVPGAGLTATARDIGVFMGALLDDDGPLTASTRRLLLTRQGPEEGLRGYTLGLTEWSHGPRTVLYHEGNGIGTTSRMMILPDEGVGIFTAVNGEALVGMGDPSPQTRFVRDLHDLLIGRFFPGAGTVEAGPAAPGAPAAVDVAGVYAPTRVDPGSVLRLETLTAQFPVSTDGDRMAFGSSELRRIAGGRFVGDGGPVQFLAGPDGTVYATRGGTSSFRRVAWWELLPVNLAWLGGSILLLAIGLVLGLRRSEPAVRRTMLGVAALIVAVLGLLAGGLATVRVMDLFTGVPTVIALAGFGAAGLVVGAGALGVGLRGQVGRGVAPCRAGLGAALVGVAAISVTAWATVWSVLPIG